MGGLTTLDDSGQLQDFIASGLTPEVHQWFLGLPGDRSSSTRDAEAVLRAETAEGLLLESVRAACAKLAFGLETAYQASGIVIRVPWHSGQGDYFGQDYTTREDELHCSLNA